MVVQLNPTDGNFGCRFSLPLRDELLAVSLNG